MGISDASKDDDPESLAVVEEEDLPHPFPMWRGSF